ncbi:MAG: xanthine permease [Clostridiales bacterium]|nr:xanthine permease [Clostridiales bacterium]
MSKKNQVIGYLPDERPPFFKLLLYAIQQVIVMFPATVTVALLTGFHISTTIFASGLATLCFLLITGKKLPLYYGSSFSYLAAIGSLMASEALVGASLDEKIAVAQFGIIMSGFVSIAAGLIVNRFGKNAVEKALPASVTGPIAMIIGLTLAGNALGDATSAVVDASTGAAAAGDPQLVSNMALLVALITLISTILFSVYLKGVLGQLPLLLGPIVGCVAALIISLTTGVNLFKQVPADVASAGVFALPHITLPKPSWMAVAAIMPVALATIPESTAHVYQLDIYVNDLAKKKGSDKRYDIESKLGLNLIGDGIGDMVAGAIGGPGGTNYGENISAMAITKVFSIPVLMAAAIIAMIISCFTPLVGAIYSIPTAVIGGLEIFLFGAIAAQGVAIMIDKNVDMFSSKNIAVIASIMIIGLGGQYAFGGNIPFFGIEVPCVAGAAIFGILLNLLLSIGSKKKKEDVPADAE